MKWVALILALLISDAHAQINMMGVENQRAAGGGGYTGPGDVVSGAKGFWGLRAYNAAYATGLNKIALICTPSDAVCANVNSDASGNFNLAGTPSLTCNNSGSICTVKTLFDQSGAANCSGACDLTQATIANRPTLIVPGAANGCPTTAKFCMSVTAIAGAPQLTSIAVISTTIPQPYTFSIVYDNPLRNGDEYMIDVTNARVISGFGGAATFVITATSSASQSVSDNAYHAVQGVFNTTSSDIDVDGTSNAPLSVGATQATGNNSITLFNITGSTTNGFSGFITEMGVWAVAFTGTPVTGQSALMSANQHGYWGF